MKKIIILLMLSMLHALAGFCQQDSLKQKRAAGLGILLGIDQEKAVRLQQAMLTNAATIKTVQENVAIAGPQRMTALRRLLDEREAAVNQILSASERKKLNQYMESRIGEKRKQRNNELQELHNREQNALKQKSDIRSPKP